MIARIKIWCGLNGRWFAGSQAILLTVLGSLVLGNGVRAEDQKIKLEDLPVPVLQTMSAAVPGAVYANAAKAQEFSQDVYTVQGKTDDGHRVRLILSTGGHLLAVNTDVPVKDVPKDVNNSLNHWMKGFQVRSVVRSAREGGTRIWYEFDGMSQSGQHSKVEIRADGKKVMIEELDK